MNEKKSPFQILKSKFMLGKRGLVAVASLMIVSSSQSATTLWFENFESGTITDLGFNATFSPSSVVTDPFTPISPGKVLKIDDASTTTEYNEFRGSGGSSGVFAISTINSPKIGEQFTLKTDVYFPSAANTTANSLLILVRLRSSSEPAAFRDISFSGTFTKDTWLRDLTVTGIIPETFAYSNGSTINGTFNTTSITPIIAWRDTEKTELGTFGYLDNISFVMTPEPGRALLLLMGLMGFVFKRRR